jgi:phosphopantothenoylcysteine decarboxylase/phosphopantothenate--cysteine ligase
VGRAARSDVVVMAAAVADYTPEAVAPEKISKDASSLTLVLRRTPDILAELGRRRAAAGEGPVLVGFAAETEEVVARAAAKRQRKHIDLVVANDVSRSDAGFDAETNAVTIIGEEGTETTPVESKDKVAGRILDRVEALLARSSDRTALGGPR